jgi:hypothetical protein
MVIHVKQGRFFTKPLFKILQPVSPDAAPANGDLTLFIRLTAF